MRRFVQYKWLATRGVDEETILHSLPADLRRDIQRHLCLDLVRRVSVFTTQLNHISQHLLARTRDDHSDLWFGFEIMRILYVVFAGHTMNCNFLTNYGLFGSVTLSFVSVRFQFGSFSIRTLLPFGLGESWHLFQFEELRFDSVFMRTLRSDS